MKLVKVSIQRSTFPIVLFTIFILVGSYFYTKLRYELMPDITTPVITVTTIYPGAGPEEVEQSVTIPIEDALSTLGDLEEISSSSMEGVSLVRLSLLMTANADIAIQETQRIVNKIRRDLPPEILEPSIDQFDISALPIIKMGVFGNIQDEELYNLADDNIVPALSKLPGVASVELLGGREREIQVQIDAHKMDYYNIPISRIRQMIQVSNLEFPTGKIKDKDGQIIIRLNGKLASLEELGSISVMTQKDGTIIRLRDIAIITDGTKEIEKIVRVNGRDAIGLNIQKQDNANAVEVSALVHAEIAKLKELYTKEGLMFEIAEDQSEFTLEAAKGVMKDLILAIVLVSLIMLLFLQSFRNSLFVLITIPTSLISTFTAMYLLDFTLDLISLMSMSMVVGTLVDDAIVQIENIYRHMEMGKNRIVATFDAVKELMMTVISTTLVLLAVFVPITFVGGIVGQLLLEYAGIISVSMLFSLLVSFTLLPFMTSRMAKLEKLSPHTWLGKIIYAFERFIDWCANGTAGLLEWSLGHKLITILVSIVLFISSVMLLPLGYIGTAFVEAGDRGNCLMWLELPKEATIEQTNEATLQAERLLMGLPEVQSVFTTVGTKSGTVSSQTTAYYAEINVQLVGFDKRELPAHLFARVARAYLEERLTGVKVSSVNVNIMGNADTPIQLQVIGSSQDSIMLYAERLEEVLRSIDGTAEVEKSVETSSPEIQVLVDRSRMDRTGLSISDIGSTLQLAFAGNTDNKFREGSSEFDINVRLDNVNRKNKADIENLAFVNPKGERVRLSQFATLCEGIGPSVLERYNRSPSVKVSSQVVGSSQGAILKEFKKKLAGVQKPVGVDIVEGKITRMMSESFADLAIAIIAAIIFVYLIMVVLYDNWMHPLVIMFSLPMAMTGALWAMALARESLNVFTMLGMIMLVGLVTKNAILVVDFTNQELEKGNALKQALINAVRLRFRPILMTNISMVIGLIPLATAQGAGASWKTGLGWALIGGMSLSMILTMVIVPLVYYVFERIRQKSGVQKKSILIEDETSYE
ncbi:efflux RND transporter permease subunit [Marinilabiliaceae bacterium JC017]|nr:efflux RND transporter permease subunit [Marinilabiliaceae bacterium JC017]